MKQGWTYKKLGEVATIVGGSTPKTSIEEYWGGTHYWVTPANLDGNKYQGATPRTITDLAVQKTNLQLLPIGTVLLSSRAPIGKVAITTVPMYCNQGFKNIVCSDLLINEFVYWYLYGKVDYLNSLGTGATFKEISKKTTEQIPIPVPSIAEQQRIVVYLDAAFAQIDELKSNAERQLAEARALFQAALTQAMQPKPGWQCLYLEDVCSHIIDCPHTTPKKSPVITNYPCIRTSELKNGRIEWSTMQYLDKAEYEKRISRLEPKPNDIVYGREGTYGDAVILPEGYHFSLGQRTMLLRPNIKIVLPAFLHKQMISTHVYNQAKAKNSGCGVGHVNVKDIKRFILHVPSITEQQIIVEQLDALSNRICELEEISRKTAAECDALKQALLRQIFE